MRKGYSEVVWQQSTEAFIGALENAFRFFGGAPRTLVIDNLKAAVKRGDWYDPEVHPKLQSFAAHYGTVFLPTKPYTPEHKGKIESGVKYVKNNALRARVFDSLQKQNAFLLDWEQTVADTRIHGTTRRHVRTVFETIEHPVLGPLPVERFPFFHEARRSVHRDGYVEVDKSYYSAPPEYVGRHVWARWDGRLVRLFNDRWEQLAVHAKTEPGRFCTDPRHIPRRKSRPSNAGPTRYCGRSSRSAHTPANGRQRWSRPAASRGCACWSGSKPWRKDTPRPISTGLARRPWRTAPTASAPFASCCTGRRIPRSNNNSNFSPSIP